jgi:hypothetical protein
MKESSERLGIKIVGGLKEVATPWASVRGGDKIPKKGGIKFPTTGGNMVSYDGETIIGGLKEDDHIGRVS